MDRSYLLKSRSAVMRRRSSREKTLPEVLRRAHDYAAEALRWLVEDGVASRVDVSAAMPRLGLLSLAVNITLVSGESSTYAFSYPLE